MTYWSFFSFTGVLELPRANIVSCGKCVQDRICRSLLRNVRSVLISPPPPKKLTRRVGFLICYTYGMFTLLVSSKTMEPKGCPFDIALTTPVFQSKAEALNTLLESKSELQLRRLMHISPKLAAATHQRINNWSTAELSPAWYSFVGDVYKGLSIEEFSADDLDFAQKHMATLSGLYGLLRPLDRITPYRLELGYKLSGKGFKNLYEFWGDSVAQQLPAGEAIINLSSEEYIKVIRPHVTSDRIVTPQFLQIKNGKPEFQAVHAKTARGMMARWICTNRIDSPSELKNFAEDRYTYSAELSTPQHPTFTREFIPVALQRQNAT